MVLNVLVFFKCVIFTVYQFPSAHVFSCKLNFALAT